MKKTICLNMIVKDESRVIRRCLDTVKNWIDYWVIVDTGSTDGTQELVKEALRFLPGELHERPWVDFQTNRNEALQLAKDRGDYLLFIDADDLLTFPEHFRMPELNRDCYAVVQRNEINGMEHLKILLVNNRLPWRWKGLLHEGLECPGVDRGEILSGVVNLYRHDGNRACDLKNKESDLEILEKAYQNDPSDCRTIFYLAQCYAAMENYPLALAFFEKRAAMGGWEEEVFYSLYRIGYLQEKMGLPSEESYIRAYLYRPSRAEPLFCLANRYIETKNFLMGYLVAKFALTIPLPSDSTFIERPVYDYLLMIQVADSALQLGRAAESLKWLDKLLTVDNLPLNKRKIIEGLKWKR